MANLFTPKDAYAIINLAVKEATGQDNVIQAVDTSSFVAVGNLLLSTGYESTLNSLAIVLGRTFMAVRPYNAKLALIDALNTGEFTHRMRKISVYSKPAIQSGDWNTGTTSYTRTVPAFATSKTNFKTGYDNGSNSGQSMPTMWEQNLPVLLENNFYGSEVWQDSITILENQLKMALRNEEEFARLMSGIMTEKSNDIESQKEAFNRLTLLNAIAGRVALESVNPSLTVNLLDGFNKAKGYSATIAQVTQGEYQKEFLEYMTATIKLTSDYMTNRTKLYHTAPDKDGLVLLRHTPKDRQRLFLFSPLLTRAESMVMPEIFNPRYLDVKNYEGVTYWQNINEPEKIKVTPLVQNKDGKPEKMAEVSLDYVVGFLFDRDAVMTDFQFEDAISTPVEARKRYRNIWWTFSKNPINDFTENGVVFYLKESE